MIISPFSSLRKALGLLRHKPETETAPQITPPPTPIAEGPEIPAPELEKAITPMDLGADIRRHFFNERGFQTYASFFSLWGGWATAGHCLTETGGRVPPFAKGRIINKPGGLDAALIGAKLPLSCPAPPREGLEVVCYGFPAGSRHRETRRGKVYIPRPGEPGRWIVHIFEPDEPVVTGMSGGPVMIAGTDQPIGILITRNSPADLNNDRDPDESFDFVALSAVWEAVKGEGGWA